MASEFVPQIPGGSSAETMTPGSAVADTLQQILAQRRAEAHSNLMEEIAKQNSDSEAQYRLDQASTNKMYREGLVSDRKDKERERQQTESRLGEAAKFATSQLATETDPFMKSMWGYIAANPERSEQFLAQIMARKEAQNKPLVPAYRLPYGKSQAEAVMVPGAPPLIGNQPLMVPQGDPRELIHDAQPNQPPSPGSSIGFEVVNDKGEKNFFMVPAHQVGMPTPPPGWKFTGMRVGVDNPPKLDLTSPYGAKEYQEYQAAIKGSGPNAAASRSSARANFIRSIRDPQVLSDINTILGDPIGRTKTYDELLKSGNLTGPPDYLEKMRVVLGAIPLNNRD